MRHRQHRNRVARIERRQAEAAFDPDDFQQCFMRSLRGSGMPEERVVALCSVPRREARAWVQVEIERLQGRATTAAERPIQRTSATPGDGPPPANLGDNAVPGTRSHAERKPCWAVMPSS
jgi:hypothetical protein